MTAFDRSDESAIDKFLRHARYYEHASELRAADAFKELADRLAEVERKHEDLKRWLPWKEFEPAPDALSGKGGSDAVATEEDPRSVEGMEGQQDQLRDGNSEAVEPGSSETARVADTRRMVAPSDGGGERERIPEARTCASVSIMTGVNPCWKLAGHDGYHEGQTKNGTYCWLDATPTAPVGSGETGGDPGDLPKWLEDLLDACWDVAEGIDGGLTEEHAQALDRYNDLRAAALARLRSPVGSSEDGESEPLPVRLERDAGTIEWLTQNSALLSRQGADVIKADLCEAASLLRAGVGREKERIERCPFCGMARGTNQGSCRCRPSQPAAPPSPALPESNPSGWIYTDSMGELRVTFTPEDLDDASRSTCVPFRYVNPVPPEEVVERFAEALWQQPLMPISEASCAADMIPTLREAFRDCGLSAEAGELESAYEVGYAMGYADGCVRYGPKGKGVGGEAGSGPAVGGYR